MKYLIDSNIIIYHLNGNSYSTDFLQENYSNSLISFITTIEVLSFSYSESERTQITAFLNEFKRIDIDENIINTTIELRQKKNIKLPDCIIAATALESNLSLVTRNSKDFNHIPKLTLIDPFHTK